MRNRIAAGAGFALVPGLWRLAEALARSGWKLNGRSYRPEKHYMRGPGPKWREKLAGSAAGARSGPAGSRRAAP